MTFTPVDYEIKVLKEAAGYPQDDLIKGAAINAASEFLREAGFMTRHGKITERGLNYLVENNHIQVSG